MFSSIKSKIDGWIILTNKMLARETNETRIAALILFRIIKNEIPFYKSSIITKEEVSFLKTHSKDLIKILGFIATAPTPIPYLLITIALKKVGINLFPSKDALEIPDVYREK